MALVTVGPAYGVAHWFGIEAKGRKKLWSYHPAGKGTYGVLSSFNLHGRAVGELGGLARRVGLESAGAASLVFVLVCAHVVNAHQPGWLIELGADGPRAMEDERIAAVLGVALREWIAARELLLAARLLECVKVQVEMAPRADVRQGELFAPSFLNGCASGRVDTERFDALRSDTVRNETGAAADSGAPRAPDAAGCREEKSSVQEKQERAQLPRAASPLDAGHTDGTVSVSEEIGSVNALQKQLLPQYAARRADLDALAHRGDETRAFACLSQGLAELLADGGQANRADRRDWFLAFMKVWQFPYGSDAAASRARDLTRLLDKAAELRADPTLRKRAAVFSSWLAAKGLRGPRRKA